MQQGECTEAWPFEAGRLGSNLRAMYKDELPAISPFNVCCSSQSCIRKSESHRTNLLHQASSPGQALTLQTL